MGKSCTLCPLLAVTISLDAQIGTPYPRSAGFDTDRHPHEKELPSKDEIIGLASIAVPPTDPLEQYLLDHENDMFMNERREIDEVFFKQGPILKHNLPVKTLRDPLPPKSDPVFDHKQLPDTLKYAYLDEKKIYPIINY